MALEGLYSAAAGMAAQQSWLDSLSNDVANVNTDGYKSSRVAFRDLAYGTSDGISTGSGSAAADAGRSFEQGALQVSSDPLSLAISGPGFFQVRRPDGQLALTRNGQFQIDANGSLVTSDGDRLAPPVTLPRGLDPARVQIAGDGTVTDGSRTLGRIQIVDVPSAGNLQSIGDNLYVATAQSGAPRAAGGSQVLQGMLEGSNVDLSSAMTDMMQAQRGYQLESRVIQTQDQLLQIANGIRQ